MSSPPYAGNDSWGKGTFTGCYEKVFANVVRLRSGADAVRDWRQFRREIRVLIDEAHHSTRLLTCDSPNDPEDARYAVVSFVDTSVMTSGLPEFEEWQSETLQNELFRTGVGGLDFFVRLDRILRRPESKAGAGLLDLFLNCILLGFEGRISQEELRALRVVLADKIARVRPQNRELSPRWRPSGRRIASGYSAAGLRQVMGILTGVTVSAAVLFVLFALLLGHGVSQFADIVAR